MTIGNKIFKLRTERNLTQKQLADMCGFSQSALNFWENGKRQPKIGQLYKIADALDIPVEYLFGEIHIGLMTEDDIEKIEYSLSKGEKDIQSVLFQFGYSLIKMGDNYIIQKIIDGIYGKKIIISQKEYDDFIKDTNFFINYLMDKLFDSHNYYFDDTAD